MWIKNLFILSISFVLFSFLSFSTVNAAGGCQPLYGGGQYGTCPPTSSIIVNKTVQNPKTGAFVDNLGINDPKFVPDQKVTFQIAVTNTSNIRIERVTVKDIFPQFITFTTGAGTFDKKNSTLSFEISSLNPNETKTFTISTKTAPKQSLPVDKDITCVTNQVVATISSNNQSTQDNSQLCLQKGLTVFPAPSLTTTPPTGPEALSLLALIPTGIIGFFTRKKAISAK